MPKGLIPLIGGLGVAGTMVGISIPSAVTVIPKKEIKPVDNSKFTGFVYNGKIYKTMDLAKRALVTQLNITGPKVAPQDGVTKYTIGAIHGSTVFSKTYSPTDTVPTAASLKDEYSWGSSPIRTTPEESTILSISNPNTLDASFTTFSDFMYSDSLTGTPAASIAKIDLTKYSYRQSTISGGRIYSKADDKYYWYKNLNSAQRGQIKVDATHGEMIDGSMAANTLPWGEVPADSADGKKCILAVRFVTATDHALIGPYIYIYSNHDWKTEFEGKSYTVNGQSTRSIDVLFNSAVTGGTGLRPGHAGTYTYALNNVSDNSKVGEKTTNSSTHPTDLIDSDINIDANQSVAAIQQQDWTLQDLTPTHLAAIQKVEVTSDFVNEDPYSPSVLPAPYLYSEEVLND